MKEKFKKIVMKVPLGALIFLFIILTAIIVFDKNTQIFSFLKEYQSEWIVNSINTAKDFRIVYHKFKAIFYIVYFVDIALLVFKILLIKESIKIMIINTFENVKVNISTNYIYENKEFYKDLSSNVKVLEKNYLTYTNIVKELDRYVENFMEEKKETYYAFAGILHTPFILRLGYKVGDGTYFKLFHKKRDEDEFKLLTSKKTYSGNYPSLKITKNIKKGNSLIVSIATTFPITDEKLSKFDIENNSLLKFEVENKGFDVIESEQQVDDYKDIIFKNIRDVVSKSNIKTIHLCIASSVAFTFALGQGFSENYDPEIIIYNYEGQEYVWGLKLFEKAENSIVKLDEKINIE